MSNPDEDIEGNEPVCYKNTPVAILSFYFPIYGIINAIRSKYNRKAAIYGAAIGFCLAMAFSFMAGDDKIGLEIKNFSLIEYEPFSLIDIIVNILIGGISSFFGFMREFLYMLLD